MQKRILVIHDYNEVGGVLNPPLRYHLESAGYRCTAPTINYLDASVDDVVQVLLRYLHEHSFDGIAGAGLGGFYALLMAKARDIPILAVNPLTTPSLQLPKFEDSHFSATRLKELMYWEPGLLDLPTERITAILGDTCPSEMELPYTQLLLEGCHLIWVVDGTRDIDTLDVGYIVHRNPDIFQCPDCKLASFQLQ